jgi:putative peptidoglycan lipid II flippase
MVKRVFNFVYKEVRGLHQAAYILALFAFGSQILAVVRDRLLAHTFGAGTELDLYYAAFRIPDLLFVLFASVLSVYVLLPFVAKRATNEGSEEGAKIISQVFTLFIILYIIVALVLALGAPYYVPMVFPGLVEHTALLTILIQILLAQVFLLGVSNLCGVVTQISHRFVLYAVSPLFYNLGIILGIIVLYPVFGLVGAAIGVVIGALGHLLIQVPYVLKSKFRFGVTSNINWSLIRDIFTVSVPRALTLSLNQIVLLIFAGIASTMAVGSVSVFQFAFNLQSVPLVIIGASYSVAAFPRLSTLLAEKQLVEFNRQLLTALRHIIFWSMPVIALVIVLRAQIVRVLLGSGQFDWNDTRLTAAILAVFVLSLVAQCILLLLIRAFYAGGRTVLPLIITTSTAALSVLLAIVLKQLYTVDQSFRFFVEDLFRLRDVLGTEVLVLALAFTLGQLIQVIIMLLASRSVFSISYRSLWRLLVQSTLASITGGLVAYITLIFIVDGVNQSTFIGISLQGMSAAIMGIIGIILVYAVLRAPELQEIYKSFKAKILKTDIVAPQPESI